jgi:hypothetical protein
MEIKKIIIIGPFCTGTNLINNILFDNCYDLQYDKKISIIENNNNYWKHTLNMELLYEIIDENTLIIVMYRNIYNWISSICITKYWFNFDKINKSVIFDFPIGKYCKIEKKFHKKCIFNNIFDIYNLYYRNYLQMKKDNKNIIYIDYKKIIMENNFDYLNNKLNEYNLYVKDKNKFITQLNKPSKNHGNCVKNNIIASEKYEDEQLKINNLIELENLEHLIDYELLNFFDNC